MMSFLSKIWFPAALVGAVTLQMSVSPRTVETEAPLVFVQAEAPEDFADTVKYSRTGYRRFWSPEEKASTISIADSLLKGDAEGFDEGEDTIVKIRPAALDSLVPPDSLLQVDSFRYHYFAALADSLSHMWVRDSLVRALDTLTWLKLDSLYAVDSVARAKAAYWAWYATLDKKGKRKADFEREMPIKQARLDSLKNAKEEAQAIKDSITSSTPRILETYLFKDSLLYQRILKWTHERDFHNITLLSHEDTTYNYRFYDYPFLREDVNASWLGVAGSPLQYFDFSKRKSREGVFFYEPVESWSYSAATLPMYNTKTPYTELCYWGTLLAGDKKESDNLHLLTTQNITPELNLTMFYDRFGGAGILEGETTRNKTAVVATNYTGKKYLMHAGFIYNMAGRSENGGVQDIRMIRDTTIEVREIAVNLSGASSKIKKNTVFLDQQFRIPFYFIEKWKQRKDRPDTLALLELPPLPEGEEDLPPQQPETTEGEEGEAPESPSLDDSKITTAFIGHSSEYSIYRRSYSDVSTSGNTKSFYDQVFNYNPSASFDSLRVMRLENKVFLRLQPWTDESLLSKLDVGIGHRLMNYYVFDKTFLHKPSNHHWNATYLYAGVEGQFQRFFQWNAHGKYVFLGDEINDFDLGAEARLNLYPFRRHKDSPVSIHARFNTSLDEPEYYQQHLYTNHFSWDNSFSKISTTTVEGGISIPYWNFGLQVAYNLLSGNLWYGTDGIIRQNSDPMSVLSASLLKNFQIGKLLHFDHRVLFQLSSRQDVIPLPLVAANARYYIQFPIGPVKAMTMQIGANAWYHTKWYLPAWNPALGVFHNQEENLYGNYPVADLFVNMQWKRACIFVKLENAGMDLFEHNDYFSADGYIRTTRAVKFGIYWPFYTQPAKDTPARNGSQSAGIR
ncbi:MAG: putative porin [Bacteroidales bacterium]|nr:putative porin [Bacteroidales bacterium]